MLRSYREEVEGLDGSVVQTHVLVQVKGGHLEGAEVGFIGEQFQVLDDRCETGHGDLRRIHNIYSIHGRQAASRLYNI